MTLREKEQQPPQLCATFPDFTGLGFSTSHNDYELTDEELEDAPPAYGDGEEGLFLQGQGLGATISDEGRVNININSKTRHLTRLLAPIIQNPAVEGESDSHTSHAGPIPVYSNASEGSPKQPSGLDVPKLNIVIQVVGSRGDVQPFVALGKVLKQTYAHRVRIATHAVFQNFVEDSGLEFFNIGGDPVQLMAFMVKHPGLMPGLAAVTSGEVNKRRKDIADILIGCWRSCIDTGNGITPQPRDTGGDEAAAWQAEGVSTDPFVADAIIANPPSFAHVHIAEKLGIPAHIMFTMPWSPTRAFPHPLADIRSSTTDDAMTNYLSYTLVEMMTWQGLGNIINRFRQRTLDLDDLSLIWAPGLVARLKVPHTYCWSPTLIAKPFDWKKQKHIDISGFYFLDDGLSFQPPHELESFLENGPPPVYIGFGSIVVDNPSVLARLLLEAIHLAGVRALVSEGWGGLLGGESGGLPGRVLALGNVPHDWLFPRVSCVVHHGGAGTTAAGIKAGKPTLVVPFFGDQFFWGNMIHRAGAGPQPIPHKDLTAQKLAEGIRFCLRANTVAKAVEYGQRIQGENGVERGAQSFHSHLPLERMRCFVAPKQAAVWRVKRSSILLSPLAAAVLVEQKILDYSELQLHRPKEYLTHSEPPDPFSASVAGLLGVFSGFGMAVADMPRELFKSRTLTTASEASSSKFTPAYSTSKVFGDWPDEMPSELGDSPTYDDLSPLELRSELADTSPSSSHPPRSPSELLAELPGDFNFPRQDSCVDIESVTGYTGSADTSQSYTVSPVTSAWDTSQAPSSDISSIRSCPKSDKKGKSAERRPHHYTKTAAGVDAVVGTTKSFGRMIGTGLKSPMNVSLGVARGFRNLPLLYNDEMVRPTEKVTGIASGLKVASKEFTFGLYDGVTGLVLQPYKGAEKDGVVGFVKGVGKGLGGLVTKPFAGGWGVPAYTMQGVHASMTKVFSRSVYGQIVKSRVAEGARYLASSSQEERRQIIERWTELQSRRRLLLPWNKCQNRHDRDAFGINLDSTADIAQLDLSGDQSETASVLQPSQTQSVKSTGKLAFLSKLKHENRAGSGNQETPIAKIASADHIEPDSASSTSKAHLKADIAQSSLDEAHQLGESYSHGLPPAYESIHASAHQGHKLEKSNCVHDYDEEEILERAIIAYYEHQEHDSNQLGIEGEELEQAMLASMAQHQQDVESNLRHQEWQLEKEKEELRQAVLASKLQHQKEITTTQMEEANLQRAILSTQVQLDQITEEAMTVELAIEQSLQDVSHQQSERTFSGNKSDCNDDEELRMAIDESLRDPGQDYRGWGSSSVRN